MSALLDLLPLAGTGALFAFGAAGAKSHRWQLPRIVRENGAEGGTVILVDLGFLAAPLLGAVVAAIVGGDTQQAACAGAVAGSMGPAILNTLLEPLLRKLGLPPASGKDEEGEAEEGLAQRARPSP
jgi:hypothetical protein